MKTKFDATTNRVPFGLLTKEEQSILQTWPRGVEYFGPEGWKETNSPVWGWTTTYRGKSSLVVISKWVNLYSNDVGNTWFDSRKKADEAAAPFRIAVLRFDSCNWVSTAHLEEA